MNVLVTSAGAKVLIVEALREAARARGMRVIAADIAEDCPARGFADDFVRLPPTSDEPAFLRSLAEICRDQHITLVVPTRDGELELLAGARDRFAAEGIRLLVSPLPAIACCRDKFRFTQFLEAHDLPILPALDAKAADLPFPLFLRPRVGAGGRGVHRIDTAEELRSVAGIGDYLVNPWIDTAKAREISIDVLMSLDGRPLQGVARTRDKIVDGESKDSTVIDAPALVRLCLGLGEKLGLVGHVIMQAFQLADGTYSFIEVNPRFGGASNLSIRAGLASPERVIAMHCGEHEAEAPRPIRIGLRMLRTVRNGLQHDDFMEPAGP